MSYPALICYAFYYTKSSHTRIYYILIIILSRTFEGSYRNLMVYDVDFMKEAFTKNYHAFTNRRVMRFGGPSDVSILNLTDDHWKYVRSALSPTFTQGKLKMVKI